MRIRGERGLDPTDKYESPWVGGEGGDERMLGGDGRFVVGIHGRLGGYFDGLGLVLLNPPVDEKPR
jgi:hypothetical protein